MFSYCNNNPVIYLDATGNAPISYHNGDRNPLFIGHVGLGGGGCGGIITGGVGTSRKTAKQQANDILQREVNYLSNTDEQVVLDADYIAFYNGVLVVKCDNSLGSFSFGFILLQNTANKAKQKKSLLHEYGHYEHLRDIGIMNYASKVVVPSVTCATLSHLGLLPAYYYDLPWEYIADQYGRVNRDGYSSWAGPVGFLYWLYSLI